MNWKEIKKSLHEISDQLIYQDGDNCMWGNEIKDILGQIDNKINDMRELILAYHNYLESFNDPTIYNAPIEIVNDFINSKTD